MAKTGKRVVEKYEVITPENIFSKIKLNIKAKSENQKKLINLIKEKEVVICAGYPGTGKTYLTCAQALELLKSDLGYNKIVLVKSVKTLKEEEIGFLKGPQPLYEKVLTPNGWVNMGDIALGDYVITENGTPSEVIGVFDQDDDKLSDIYRLTTKDGRYVDACLNHKWNVKTKKLDYITVDTNFLLEHIDSVDFYLPELKPVEFQENESLTLNPYLLGLLISDGLLRTGNLKLSVFDSEIISKVNNIVKEYDLTLTTNETTQSVNKKVSSGKIEMDDDLIGYINEMLTNLNLLGCKSYEEFIPIRYKQSTIENRIELLRGLLDTGGIIKNNGKITYTTTSEQLANDVCDLVWSLGGSAKKNKTVIEKLYEKWDSFTITITFSNNDFNPFYLSRKAKLFKPKNSKHLKISKIEKIGQSKIRCIKIDSPTQLYVTKDFIVTHNTMEEKMEPFIYSFINNFEKLVGKEVTEKLREFNMLEILPIAYMRGINIDNAIVVCDEVQNIGIDNIKTILTRLGFNSKMIFLGDTNQIDSKNKKDSALGFMLENFSSLDEIGTIELRLDDVVRNPLIKKIEEIFKNVEK